MDGDPPHSRKGCDPGIVVRDDGSLPVGGQCLFCNFPEYPDFEGLYAGNDYGMFSGPSAEFPEHISRTGEKLS